MPEIEAVRRERERERERETYLCRKCLQLCGDAAPLAFNLTTVVGQVSPRSVKIAVHLKILNVYYLFIIN